MLNFYRNLLLNISSSTQPSDEFSEYIDSSFKVVNYPSYITNVENILFKNTTILNFKRYLVDNYIKAVYNSKVSSYLSSSNPYSYDVNNQKYANSSYSVDLYQIVESLEQGKALNELLTAASLLISDNYMTPLKQIISESIIIDKLAAILVVLLLVKENIYV